MHDQRCFVGPSVSSFDFTVEGTLKSDKFTYLSHVKIMSYRDKQTYRKAFLLFHLMHQWMLSGSGLSSIAILNFLIYIFALSIQYALN